MIRTPVKSSYIAAIGYDAEKKVLEVEFKRGDAYRYFDVPQDVYDGLIAASQSEDSSVGKLFSSIRGAFAFERVEPEEPEAA
jgi:hypothetical protein